MKPGRSNYEIWITDWLDGNLSPEQTGQLIDFFKENPDLAPDSELEAPLKIYPGDHLFSRKEELKKSPGDLSLSQVEYLSVALLENDLDNESCAELLKSIENDSQKKEAFNLIGKMKLSPQPGTYTKKLLLKKRSIGTTLLRLSFGGLSAAAAVALLLLVWFRQGSVLKDEIAGFTQPDLSDTLFIRSAPAVIYEERSYSRYEGTADIPHETGDLNLSTLIPPAGDGTTNNIVPSEELPSGTNSSFERITISRVEVAGPTGYLALNAEYMSHDESGKELIVPEVPDFSIFADDGRSNVERFMARFFHEKIMKEEKLGDKPVKGYEIAEAGINGINKLLGWEMALLKNTDGSGSVTSVYFSSKMLRFNAPLKKSSPSL